VVLEERWANGEWFRSGAVWQGGKGRVFYFRPEVELVPLFPARYRISSLQRVSC